MAQEDTVRPVFIFLEKTEIGYVHCPPNCSYSVVRREIEVDELDALKGKNFCFLGLRRIPISRRQEERHFCRENTVEVAFLNNQVLGQAVCEPVCEAVNANECDIPKETLDECAQPLAKKPRTETGIDVVITNSSKSTTETYASDGSREVTMMQSKLAKPGEVAAQRRRLDNAKSKLAAINRHDKFELTSCDEDGKARFKIFCRECNSTYGTGSEDMWYNFLSSHCKTKAHLDKYFARVKEDESLGALGAEEREQFALEANKKRVQDLMEGELAKWSMENGTSFSLYTPSVGDYSNLKKILITCDICSRGLKLFPPSGSAGMARKWSRSVAGADLLQEQICARFNQSTVD